MELRDVESDITEVLFSEEQIQGRLTELAREIERDYEGKDVLIIAVLKGAVMVLPSGTNKATGLLAALGELGISAHNVVAVGDAENDYAFLRACGCSAAVSNNRRPRPRPRDSGSTETPNSAIVRVGSPGRGWP